MLILPLPNFIQNVQNDINNHLLIYYGDYYQDTFCYSINDFVNNPNISIQRVKVLINGNKSNKYTLENKYLILTDLYFIILTPNSKGDKNLYAISFYEKITSIHIMKKVDLEDEHLSNNAFQVEWKPNVLETFDNILILDKPIECLNEIGMRLGKIDEFKNIFDTENHSVESMQEMIKIKVNFLEEYFDSFAYQCINEMYNLILGKSLLLEDNYHTEYLKQMQNLFNKYNND